MLPERLLPVGPPMDTMGSVEQAVGRNCLKKTGGSRAQGRVAGLSQARRMVERPGPYGKGQGMRESVTYKGMGYG